MSSPLSSLKKEKKLPFEVAKRAPPFRRNINGADEESSLHYLHDQINSSNSEKTGLSDLELMSSMVTKLSQTEKKLQFAEQEIKQKDKEIKILKERCQNFEDLKGNGNNGTKPLEEKCMRLQAQIHSMEQFLEDYGMIWVGNEQIEGENDEEEELKLLTESPETGWSKKEMWNPVKSTNAFYVDFDVVLANIEELNKIAAEEQIFINKSKGRAKFDKRDAVRLILYSNGIFMFDGPFRSYDEPETEFCIRDLMEGYFPSELQTRFPNGVIFDAIDKRDVPYQSKRHQRLFPGTGKCLASESSPENVNTLQTITSKSNMEETKVPGMKTKTTDQFLQGFPSNVIRQGVVVDVRSDLKQHITGIQGKTQNGTIIIDTPVVIEMKERMEKEPNMRPPTPGDITTLRIRSEEGSQIYLLKMKYSDTIGDVHFHLNKYRGSLSTNYILRTSFPSRIYEQKSSTLLEGGLTPNANLMISLKK